METIYEILKHHAGENNDLSAIADVDETRWTYGELLQEVDQIGAQLKASGISPGDPVALVLNDGAAMAISFLAVSSAAICAPLNPKYRSRDFAFYLDDLKARAVIVAAGSDSEVIPVAGERDIPVFTLTVGNPASGPKLVLDTGNVNSAEALHPSSTDTAMILHTSGTTSRPKMVPLSHGNLVASAGNVSRTLSLSQGDRGLAVMPLFHIHGLVGALLSAMYAGSSIVCTPGFDAVEFLNWARKYSVTWYSAVPTMHQALLGHALANPNELEGVSLRVVRSSSASLPPKVFHDLAELWQAPVVESYGMTEAAHQMTSNPVGPGAQKPGSVGLPAGPEVSVRTEDGSPAGPNEIGAIHIKGPNVTKGYLNNEKANAENFSDGWFATGDQGYFDEDGYLFLTGRLKEMINRGGENIAPREIDEILLEHAAVSQATAFAIPHESLGEDLAAAVVLKDGTTVSEQVLRDFIADKLADFKVPSRIVFVQSIPKGPTGKLQRIGLHEKLADALSTDFVEPRTETEARLVQLFKESLQVEKIGVLDNFFLAGGDSLKATRVVAALRKEFPGDLPLTLIFRYPTAEQCGAHLDSLTGSDNEIEALARDLESLSPEEIEKLLSDEP